MQGPLAGVQKGLGHLAARWAPLRGAVSTAALIKVPPLVTLAEHRLAGASRPR
jgi:hypothetical protein